MTHPNPGFTTRIHPVIDTPLGRLIRDRRRAMGISQSALARAMACDNAYISRIEGGTRALNVDYIPAVSAALGIDPVDLALAIAGLDPAAVRAAIVAQTLDDVIQTLTARRDVPAGDEEGQVAA
ncbi:MAG: helix-turn-helix domain-containing protein [Chloroflexota bacterium]|nr:helix-turn-helix domain-containing protein [Chloroflexota bacterium]